MPHVTLGNFQCLFEPWAPNMGRIFDMFAYDTETTEIIDDRPDLVPEFVLGTACHGERGVFLTRETVLPFFITHTDVPCICHNAAFDLKVTQNIFGDRLDVYRKVDDNKVWDTLILKRLLSLATAGHTARGEASLRDCAKAHLGLDLDKESKDSAGRTVRRNFGQFLYRPIAAIPAAYLRYAAGDSLATWHLFWGLNEQIKQVLRGAHQAFGHVDDDWLRSVVDRFGPLTHHVQLRASIIVGELTRAGIAIDTSRVAAKSTRIGQEIDECLQQLEARGYRPGQKGNSRVLQEALVAAAQANPAISLIRTASGEKWSTAGEHLEVVAAVDPFFEVFLEHRHAQKLQKTYLAKMHCDRVHARFGYLAATGRTYCGGGGGLNLQNLPKESDSSDATPENPTIRSAFIPAPGNVFIDSDLSQIELVVLAYIWKHQLGLGDSLYSLVNTGQDVHRLIAAAVLNKPLDQVTKADRNSAKPVSFGRPGGMSGDSLQRIAHLNYGLDLTIEEVDERIAAYHRLCPELDAFLNDEVPSALILAEHLGLTPWEYSEARGDCGRRWSGDDSLPAEWLSQMLLKVVAEPSPVTQKGAGRPYTPEELEYFWSKAEQMVEHLSSTRARDVLHRRPNKELACEVRNWAGRRPVITVTGRLRANATFCASRNTLFQGAAADGAIFGLWRIWRAGYRLKAFIHDQVVVEAAADEHVHEHVAIIEQHMKDGILEIVPGMNVKVETSITKSLDKNDVDLCYRK